MALSVLSININEGSYGLYDSISEKFIMIGSSQEMYKLKHEIEEAEQQDDNRAYFQNLILKYAKMFDSIKSIESGRPNNIQKKIELFEKYINKEDV